MRTTTEQARMEYLQDNAFWAAGLIRELESRSSGSGLHWAADTLLALIDQVAPAQKNKFSAWVGELSSWNDAARDPAFKERMEAIWYESEDAFHRALANLFAAKAHFLRGDQGQYRFCLVTAIRLLGAHEHCRKTAAAVPLVQFEKHLEEGERS